MDASRTLSRSGCDFVRSAGDRAGRSEQAARPPLFAAFLVAPAHHVPIIGVRQILHRLGELIALSFGIA